MIDYGLKDKVFIVSGAAAYGACKAALNCLSKKVAV